MSYPFSIERSEDYLLVTFSGQFTLDAAKRSVDALVAACARQRCANVLFDCRPMTGALSIMNRFEVAEYAASVIPSSLKIAMLGRLDQILPDRFLENVARNRGMTLALFSERDDAVEWLRSETSTRRGLFRCSIVGALCLATTLIPAAATVEPVTPPPVQQEAEIIWSEAVALVPTRLVFPPGFDAAEPHTLVIALHGYGGSAEAFRRVGERLAEAGLLVALPQPPYAFLAEGRLGFDWTLHHRDDDALSNRAAPPLIEDFLPTLAGDLDARYALDGVYTLGFSQGAVLATGTAIFNPEIFDGAVAFGLPAFSPDWFPGKTLSAGRDVDVLLIHGDADDRVPFAVSAATRDLLEAAGYEVELRPFRGGHSVPDEQIDGVARWIRERSGRRDPPLRPSGF